MIPVATILCDMYVFFSFLDHKFITQYSIAVRGKSPSTLQYTAQTIKINLTRNVKQNPDHSQLIQTQVSKGEKVTCMIPVGVRHPERIRLS